MEAGKNPIAQCEAAMVWVACVSGLANVRHRDVIFFVDNTASLHALVKGSSRNEQIDRTVQLVHLWALEARCRLWFEFVPSEQNWADGISRNGLTDSFAAGRGLTPSIVPVQTEHWTTDLRDAWDKLIAEVRLLTAQQLKPKHLLPCLEYIG